MSAALLLGASPAVGDSLLLAGRDRAAAPATLAADLAPAPDPRPPFASEAAAVLIVEAETGRVLISRAADRRRAPASLTKLMTAFLVFEALDAGAFALEDRVSVSARAAGMRGSSMGLRVGDRPSVDALLFGLLVNSGNDAATALAEVVAGDEARFARRMTRTAERLGIAARFRNASGWPAPEHRASARALGTLAALLWRDHAARSAYYAAPRFDWPAAAGRPSVPGLNRNPLIRGEAGVGWRADGMKTGFTTAAGHSLIASARTEDGAHVIAVLMGFPSEAARARGARAALDWAVAARALSASRR